MNKTKFKYVKYTKVELERYVRDKKSCIKRLNSELHVGFPPWGFANFEDTLTNIISRDKIGKHDANLNGIVLEVRNIKVLGTVYPVHDDDPYNHINIRANFYVFQPQIGSIIKGVVKHISHGHVAVIIYRVFNVSIRFDHPAMQDSLKINQPISFCIKKFELQGAMPYIQGELVDIEVKANNLNKHLKFENELDDDANNDGGDSGISTEETNENTSRKVESEAMSSSNSNNNDSSSSESESESESESDSDSDQHGELVNGLFSNVRIKQEKLSDSEENTKLKIIPRLENIKNEPNTSSDESDDSDESTGGGPSAESSGSESEVNIKQEKQSHSNRSDESSSSESEDGSSDTNDNQEQEQVENIKVPTTFIPRPIKTEPQSDTEGVSKFKTPKTPNRSMKRKSNEQHSSSTKRKENDQSFENVTAFESPIMSSTLKIKQEPASEDESNKRKRSKKTQNNSKSLKSIESELFDSFLQ